MQQSEKETERESEADTQQVRPLKVYVYNNIASHPSPPLNPLSYPFSGHFRLQAHPVVGRKYRELRHKGDSLNVHHIANVMLLLHSPFQ